MAWALPVGGEQHRKVIFCVSQNPGGIMGLFVEQLIIYFTPQIRVTCSSLFLASLFFCSFPLPVFLFFFFSSPFSV